jgi:hypothetical protein
MSSSSLLRKSHIAHDLAIYCIQKEQKVVLVDKNSRQEHEHPSACRQYRHCT